MATFKNKKKGGVATWGDSLATWGSAIFKWGSPTATMANLSKHVITPLGRAKTGVFLATEALDFLMTEDDNYIVVGGQFTNLTKN